MLELKGDEKIRSIQNWKILIWIRFALFQYFCHNLLHKCPRVENLQLFSLTQIPKKKKNHFGGQKWDGS